MFRAGAPLDQRHLMHVDRYSYGPGHSVEMHLKKRDERLAVSRSYVHLFR